MGWLKRLLGRDDNGTSGNDPGLGHRIAHREERAIEALASRREREADEYTRQAQEDGNQELMTLADQSRREAAQIRRVRDISEHEDLLKALGVDGEPRSG